MTDQSSSPDTSELLNRAEHYLNCNAAESGADVLIAELADALRASLQPATPTAGEPDQYTKGYRDGWNDMEARASDAVAGDVQAARTREPERDEYFGAHEVYCNASRKLPVGCDGCSCRAGREIKRLRDLAQPSLAALALGCYMTAAAGDGEYQIKIGFASLADMQEAYKALVAAISSIPSTTPQKSNGCGAKPKP